MNCGASFEKSKGAILLYQITYAENARIIEKYNKSIMFHNK